MTEKQKIFCDEYLIDLNATRAYKAAYPNVKNNSVAKVNGHRLLTNANLQKYIQKRLEEKEDALIAKQDEVLKYLTSTMRREKKENIVVACKTHKSWYDDKGKKQIEDKEEPIIVEIPAKISDANKAAELLGKYYTLFTERTEIGGNSSVVIINDIPRSELDVATD